MPAEAARQRRGRIVAAIALASCWLAVPLIEFTRGERFADTDDPSIGFAFLRESGPAVALTGAALLAVAAVLVVAVAAFEAILRSSTPGAGLIARGAVAIFGCLAAGLLLLAGAVRLSSPGPLLHFAGIDEEWGRTGYLVMHLVGTQGAIPAARVTLGGWMLGVVVLAVRRRVLAPWLLATVVVPAVLLLAVVGPIAPALVDGPAGEVGWLAIMAAFLVGVPAWCLVVAGALLARPPQRGVIGKR